VAGSQTMSTEPVFVTFKEPRNRFRGIDSASLCTVAWQVSTTNRDVVPARQAENRFLGSLKGFKNTGSAVHIEPNETWEIQPPIQHMTVHYFFGPKMALASAQGH
jgi:hypothetical protein